MSDNSVQVFLILVGCSFTALAVLMGFLVWRVSTAVRVTIAFPTELQAMVEQVIEAQKKVSPEELKTAFEVVTQRLAPPINVADNALVTKLVDEGVQLAEVSTLKGPDRFRIARDYVESRAAAMNATVDLRDVALRIEAAVASKKVRP